MCYCRVGHKKPTLNIMLFTLYLHLVHHVVCPYRAVVSEIADYMQCNMIEVGPVGTQ